MKFKNLLLVYNPFSGARTFKDELDTCVSIFQKAGYFVNIFRCIIKGDIDIFLSQLKQKDYYKAIVVSGGDGTINIVLNSIMKYNLKTTLGIIPSGTANDFATYLKISKETKEACKVIASGKKKACDIGLANNTYFINVFAAGLFTNISQQVDEDFKNFFGKFAYYLKGIEQIPNFMPMPVRITTSNDIIEEDIYLFYLLNTAGTGGFENLVKDAAIDDGYFDFVAIKARPMVEIAVLFVKILKGEYLDDPNIIYFKDNNIKIEALSNDPLHDETDIDGEVGPDLPVVVKNLSKAIDIFIP